MSSVTAVAALAARGVIGVGRNIPWDIPGEQAQFRELTLGGTLIMGRSTFDSIGRALPGRRTIVVSHDNHWLDHMAREHLANDTVIHASAPRIALRRAEQFRKPIFVVGGAQIYEALLPDCDRMVLTHVERDVEGDVFFPEIDPNAWLLESLREEATDVDSWKVATYVRA